jgi:glycosyltransferase involved in cell wall biosynthesis
MTERRHERRRIAMIAPYAVFPPDEGGRVRIYNIIKHLAARYDVTLLTPSLGGAHVDLPVTVHECIPGGRRHQLFSLRFLRRARRIFRSERPDAIVAEFIWHGLHGALLARLLRSRFVLDSHNVESLRFRSAGAWYWRAVAAWEWLVMRLAHRVLVVSDEDRASLIALGVRAAKIQVVPNGVDGEKMHPDESSGAHTRRELGIAPETKLLLFFGQLSYAPNREALEILRDRVLPMIERRSRDFQLIIIGKGDTGVLRRRFDHTRVRFLGVVDDLAPYINAADAVIVPVLSGGGSRLKILESIACGTPVVSTSMGAEGIDREICGGLLRVTDDWEVFAELALAPNAAPRRPPRSFLDAYEWHNIVSRLQL